MQRPGQISDPALHFLTSRIDYERTASVPYGQRDFRLDRMRELLERLGNPQYGLKIVHVAGTKGKGSVAATLASIFQSAGIRTGLYSSPHLDRVEERLIIDGQECPAAELNELVARVQRVVEAMDALVPSDPRLSNRPTYFEIVTALSLLRFAEHRVGATVLEVGLGGRLDSTNVCDPLVSVITSISYDHTQQLGNTLAAIAGEKAGIIKPGRPVISGVLALEAQQVIHRVAAEQRSPLVQLGRDFDYEYQPPRELDRAPAWGQMNFTDRSEGTAIELADLKLKLAGRHQAANAAVALATVCQLRRLGWELADADVRRGLAAVRWPARIEVLRRDPCVVLDAAHNVASAEALAQVLRESFVAPRRLLIFATTRDKDARGMLRVLLPEFDEVILTRYWSNPRGVPPEELAALAAELSATPVQVCSDAATAWQLASAHAKREQLICICGSFFIAAEMRAAIAAAGGLA